MVSMMDGSNCGTGACGSVLDYTRRTPLEGKCEKKCGHDNIALKHHVIASEEVTPTLVRTTAKVGQNLVASGGVALPIDIEDNAAPFVSVAMVWWPKRRLCPRKLI